jgi:catechol 2,3-dioxygenase-like lactoylglutathione lyase family enzyme
MPILASDKERGSMKSNWEFNHLGVFAKDFDRTLHYYKSLGLAPDLPPPTVRPFSLKDEAVTIEFGQVVHNAGPEGSPFLALIYIGDLELEVLHAPKERPKGEALAYGEGANHLCFSVPDIDEETDKLVKKGLRIIQDFKLNGKRLEDYLDTREYGNILLSLRTPMTEEMKKRKASYGIVNWKFHGPSAVVRDVDKTAKYYQYLGIATVQPQVRFDSSSITGVKVYGKPPKTPIRAKTRIAQIGRVLYELIQPLEGEGIFKESLDRRGEGIIALTFTVDDLERETDKLVKKGVSVIFSGKPRTGRAFAYFDTREDGGDVMIKLMSAD